MSLVRASFLEAPCCSHPPLVWAMIHQPTTWVDERVSTLVASGAKTSAMLGSRGGHRLLSSDDADAAKGI